MKKNARSTTLSLCSKRNETQTSSQHLHLLPGLSLHSPLHPQHRLRRLLDVSKNARFPESIPRPRISNLKPGQILVLLRVRFREKFHENRDYFFRILLWFFFFTIGGIAGRRRRCRRCRHDSIQYYKRLFSNAKCVCCCCCVNIFCLEKKNKREESGADRHKDRKKKFAKQEEFKLKPLLSSFVFPNFLSLFLSRVCRCFRAR